MQVLKLASIAFKNLRISDDEQTGALRRRDGGGRERKRERKREIRERRK